MLLSLMWPKSYRIVTETLCNGGKLEIARDLLDQMTRFGVGVPSQLQKFAVDDAFVKAGVGGDIRRVPDIS